MDVRKLAGQDDLVIRQVVIDITVKVQRGDETIVDYTQKKGKVPSRKILGVRYKEIKTIKRGTQKLVKKKGAEFRREKDIDTLSRIKEVERIEDIFNKL